MGLWPSPEPVFPSFPPPGAGKADVHTMQRARRNGAFFLESCWSWAEAAGRQGSEAPDLSLQLFFSTEDRSGSLKRFFGPSYALLRMPLRPPLA